jgi:hypothetical protein
MTTTSTDTYNQIGIREDLTDAIYNVDPTDTPFVTMAPKVKAKQTFHEWQTDSYAAAGLNTAIEGADATFSPAAATTRLGNYTQISEKTAMVSGTLEATDRAGRDREMTYQLLKRGVELRRDMEHALVGVNNARVGGGESTAREAASVQAYINSNTDFGATGADPTGDGTDARTPGTQRAFTESLLEGVIDQIWEAGGNPDYIMTGSFNKRAMNGFVGRASSAASVDTSAKDKKIFSAVDVYVSDYGDLKMIPNRFSLARDALILQKDKWAVAFLRNMFTQDIAKTGDADKKQILVEFTLEARNEKSSGGVFDLTTS